jgi:hypothetical protein
MSSAYNNYIHNIAKQCILAESIEHALTDGYKVCREYAVLNEGISAKVKNIFGAGLVALSALAGTVGLTGCDIAHDEACGHYIQNIPMLKSHMTTPEAIEKYHIDTVEGKEQLMEEAKKVADSLYMTNAEGEMGSSYIKYLAKAARSLGDFGVLASAVDVGHIMLNSIKTGKCTDGMAYEEKDIDKYPYNAKRSTTDSFMNPSIGFSNGKVGVGFGSGVPGFNFSNIVDF